MLICPDFPAIGLLIMWVLVVSAMILVSVGSGRSSNVDDVAGGDLVEVDGSGELVGLKIVAAIFFSVLMIHPHMTLLPYWISTHHVFSKLRDRLLHLLIMMLKFF